MFGAVNEVKTKANAREILKQYRSMARKAGQFIDIQSPCLSDMPKGQLTPDRLERAIIRKVDAKRACEEILQVLDLLPKKEAAILKYSYCFQEKYTMNEIAAKVPGYRINQFGEREEYFYSVKNIEKLKSEALLYFAEGYQDGILIEWE